MRNIQKTAFATAAFLTTACASVGEQTLANTTQPEAEFESCIRTIMQLDEGTWNYMGTIARLSGGFGPYQTTSVHSSAGPDTWSNQSFGGDVEGDEGDKNYVRLVGNAIIPLVDGKLQHENKLLYTSCEGPDAEGRYASTVEYSMALEDGTRLNAKSTNWASDRGSYYAEFLTDQTGRIVARRSGVTWPVEE